MGPNNVQGRNFQPVASQPGRTKTTSPSVKAKNTDACCGCGTKANSAGGGLTAATWGFCCFPCGLVCCAITTCRALEARADK